MPKECQFHKQCRINMVGLHWAATDSQQANQSNRSLVIVEFEYGTGSLKGKGGLQKHAQNIDDFLGIETNLKIF